MFIDNAKKNFCLIFSILASGIGFLTTVYMARTISVEAMGIVGLFMAILFVSPQIISFASTGLISINKVRLNNDEFLDFSKSYITFGFINFVIIFFIACIVTLSFVQYWQVFFILPILSFLMFLNSFHQAEMVQEKKAKNYGVYNLYVQLFLLLSL